MPTPQELTKFLTKRGFDVKVAKRTGPDQARDTYIITARSDQTNQINKVLSEITQPGRFLVYGKPHKKSEVVQTLFRRIKSVLRRSPDATK